MKSIYRELQPYISHEVTLIGSNTTKQIYRDLKWDLEAYQPDNVVNMDTKLELKLKGILK